MLFAYTRKCYKNNIDQYQLIAIVVSWSDSQRDLVIEGIISFQIHCIPFSISPQNPSSFLSNSFPCPSKFLSDSSQTHYTFYTFKLPVNSFEIAFKIIAKSLQALFNVVSNAFKFPSVSLPISFSASIQISC